MISAPLSTVPCVDAVAAGTVEDQRPRLAAPILWIRRDEFQHCQTTLHPAGVAEWLVVEPRIETGDNGWIPCPDGVDSDGQRPATDEWPARMSGRGVGGHDLSSFSHEIITGIINVKGNRHGVPYGHHGGTARRCEGTEPRTHTPSA